MINYELAEYLIVTLQIINYELAHYVDEENVFLEPSMLDGEFAAPELLQGRVSTTAVDIW